MTAVLRALGGLAMVLALVALEPLPASAGLGSAMAAGQRGARLEVASQTPFVPSEGEFVVRLSWNGPVVGHELRTRIFQVVGEEADLEARTPSGQLNQLPPIPLTDLERDDEGNLVLRIPIRSLPLPAGDAERIYLPDPGVYPLEFEITGPTGDKVTSLFTDLIRLPTETAEIDPVPVAVLLRVGPGGVSVPEATELLEEASPSIPLTIVVDPTVLDRVAAADPAVVDRFAEALDGRPVVASNEVGLDASALAEIGHLELYEQVRASAADRVTEQLSTAATTDIVFMEELPTLAAAEHLIRSGVDALLRPTGAADGVVRTSAGTLPVVSPDRDLMQALGRSGLDAYHVLARLAVRFQQGETRPVLLTADSRLGVTAGDLGVVLNGLDQAGIIRPVALERIATRSDATLFPAERPRQDLRSTARLLEATLDDLEEYRAFYVDGPLPPAYLEDRILAALAVDVAPDQRSGRLQAVRSDIREAFDVITLPEGRTVNLAATTSPLPLTLTSEADGPRRVRITFSSDKLTFPQEEGDSRLVELDQGTSALDFVVESRSLGVSPLDVVISTPDGSRELARTRITIRSTAVPGLGLLLSGAALVFLIGWWILHVARGRAAPHQIGTTEPVR